jgi:hypothetical protein
MSDRVSGMKEIKYTRTVAGPDGKLRTDGTVIFFAKLDDRETTLEVPFKNAQSENDAYNEALKVLHATAVAFGQIQPR